MDQMKKSLEKALRIDEREIAGKIKSIGFKCQQCAKCCKEEFGDNTVAVFPFEIRRICHETGLNREDITIPAPSEDKDSGGNIHTFEWVLRKRGDCMFLMNGLCSIYRCRPHICKTYPFYLYEGKLMVSLCDGLGGRISSKESLELARLLKERQIIEIEESIALFEKFRGFIPGGNGNICVHDSEGEHWMIR